MHLLRVHASAIRRSMYINATYFPVQGPGRESGEIESRIMNRDRDARSLRGVNFRSLVFWAKHQYF